MTNLSRRVGSAATLLLIRRVWGGIVSLGVIAYLARVLPAEDFGLLAFSEAVVAILAVLATSGLAEYVVFYRGRHEGEVHRTVLWIGILAVLALAAAFVVVSLVVPDIRERTTFRMVCYLLLANALFTAIGAVPRAVMRRDLDLRDLVRVDLVVATLANGAKVAMAYFGAGVYSLVVPALGASLVSAPLLLRIAGVSLAPPSSWVHARACMEYTRHVLAQRVLGLLVRRSDPIVIGGIFGATLLGTYHIALQYLTMILGYGMTLVMSLAMPVLSEARDDRSGLRARHLRGTQLVGGFAIPLIVFQVAFVDHLLPLAFGERWTLAPLLAFIAAPCVLMRSLSSPSSALYLATGKPRVGTVMAGVHGLALAIAAVATYRLDFTVFVIAISAVHLIISAAHIIIGSRMVGTPPSDVVRSLLPVFLACALSGLAGRAALALDVPAWVVIPLMPMAALAACRVFWPGWLAEFLSLADPLTPAFVRGKLQRLLRLSSGETKAGAAGGGT